MSDDTYLKALRYIILDSLHLHGYKTLPYLVPLHLNYLSKMRMKQNGSPVALGTENVGKLLMQYAIPAIIAMASSLYNITDSIFIGHGVGALAISGLALTFPLMNLAAAFGSLVGIGASTLMSVRLGQKRYETANKILGNVFILNIILGLAYTVVMLLFLDPILYFFGASAATPTLRPSIHGGTSAG